MHAPRADIERTYKARDVEGIVDLLIYRRIGFRLAQFFARLNWTPVGVTLLGGAVGLVAGRLYFYQSIALNLFGFALHVVANALDNADGQLARLTNQQSREGRIIDSVVDHIIFANIYVNLAWCAWNQTGSTFVLFLAGAAALSHAIQGGMADYFRNAYLHFENGAEWDTMSILRERYRSTAGWRKALLFLYINFTQQQEWLAPNLRRLRDADVVRQFPEHARPLLRGWGFLMTNTRMFVLLLVLLLEQPTWWFWFEIVPLNLLLVYLIARQESLARRLLP